MFFLPAVRALQVVVGVDVGTGSARAGAFTLDGRLVKATKRPITTYYEDAVVEQTSNEIWHACCECVREVSEGLDVRGLGFDATCSLVVDESDRDVIVWMDHRAKEQAARINSKPWRVLESVGGRVSPEMEIPKILWLLENGRQPDQLFDLADFLTWKATGSRTRSLCTVVCKWNYVDGWDTEYFQGIGIPASTYDKFGSQFLPPGDRIGVVDEAARELGLPRGTPVATGAIDAHAGGIGCVGYPGGSHVQRLALVAGTSACHMASSERRVVAPGVWGPYPSAMVPGCYLNEGGQTAAGALLDHIAKGFELSEILERCGDPRATKHLHVDPDFRGNRSPLADPERRGTIVGLSMDDDVDATARLYLATCQALAYQTRHIIETLRDAADDPNWIDEIVLCGGLAKNNVFVKSIADATGLPVSLPREDDAVLLGAAVLAAKAAGVYPDIPAAMAAMTDVRSTCRPDADLASFHDAKYSVFRDMSRHAKLYRDVMSQA